MSVQKLALPSGRSLDYIVTGSTAQDAALLIYLHGTPSAYPLMKSLVNKCKEQNFKLLSFSRPGYGDSTRRKGSKVVDIVDDVQALADLVGAKEFFVCGWSGGGPLSLACAAKLPGCKGALCIAGVAPYDAQGLDFLEGQGQSNIDEFKATLKGEDEVRRFVDKEREGLVKANAKDIVEEMSSILPDVDKKVLLENDDIGTALAATFQEALKHNCDGWVDDDLSCVSPWGFELSEIRTPVFLYQGSVDLMVPYGHGIWLSKALPAEYLTTHLIEGEGHISIWLGYMDQMLKELASLRR